MNTRSQEVKPQDKLKSQIPMHKPKEDLQIPMHNTHTRDESQEAKRSNLKINSSHKSQCISQGKISKSQCIILREDLQYTRINPKEKSPTIPRSSGKIPTKAQGQEQTLREDKRERLQKSEIHEAN
jgi:hypothetical protein